MTLTHSGYWPRQSHAHGTFDKSMSSTAGDFRNLTPLVLMAALRAGRHPVYEPMHRFRLELPADALAPVAARCWPHCGATPTARPARFGVHAGGSGAGRPGARSCSRQLPALTRGEGVLETAFDHTRRWRGRRPNGPAPTTTR